MPIPPRSTQTLRTRHSDDHNRSTDEGEKTDAGSGSHGIRRVIDASRPPSPDPRPSVGI